MPRELHPRNEGLLAAWMRVTFRVAGRFDLKRPMGGEQSRRCLHGLADRFFQRLLSRRARRRKVQVLRETVVAEIELLERRPAFEDQGLAQLRLRGDPGEQVAESVVLLNDHL